MKFSWKEGTRFSADAELVGAELYTNFGEIDGIKPANLIQYAETNPDSELVKCFEWDNNKAAHQHRLQQARRVLRSLEVIEVTVVERSDSKPARVEVSVRAFQNIRGGLETEDRRYVKTHIVLSDDRLRNELFENARKEFFTFQKKYESVLGLKKLFEVGKDIFS